MFTLEHYRLILKAVTSLERAGGYVKYSTIAKQSGIAKAQVRRIVRRMTIDGLLLVATSQYRSNSVVHMVASTLRGQTLASALTKMEVLKYYEETVTVDTL